MAVLTPVRRGPVFVCQMVRPPPTPPGELSATFSLAVQFTATAKSTAVAKATFTLSVAMTATVSRWQTRIDWSALDCTPNWNDLNAPGIDLRTWGGNVDADGYLLANLSELHGATNLRFCTGGAERVRVDATGLAVGKTSPGTRLSLVGLPSYASNAAALAGGLTAGDFYVMTGTDPREIAVVY